MHNQKKKQLYNKIIKILTIVECVLLVLTLIAGGMLLIQMKGTAHKNTGNEIKTEKIKEDENNKQNNSEDNSGRKSPDKETQPDKTDQKSDEKEESFSDQKIKDMVSEMTLEEKIGQMFIISPETLVENNVSTVVKSGTVTRKYLEKYPVGGLFYTTKNLNNPEQVKEMLKQVQEYSMQISGIPLFLTVDEEGGTVARVAEQSAFNVKNVGNMRDINTAEEARQAGMTIGSYLQKLGFNLDFAPVADVITNNSNQVVAKRSFGSSPEFVSECVLAFMEGMHENYMLGCLKHFPGHGATAADSHEGLAVSNHTKEQINDSELVPFQKGIDAGIQIIMVGHISLPEVTGNNDPASLSEKLVTELLRDQMGFDGVVITDAMNMGAISNNYKSTEAVKRAVQAGVDIILLPADFKSSYNALVDAVKNGKIPEERIDESVTRILRVKMNMMSLEN